MSCYLTFGRVMGSQLVLYFEDFFNPVSVLMKDLPSNSSDSSAGRLAWWYHRNCDILSTRWDGVATQVMLCEYACVHMCFNFSRACLWSNIINVPVLVNGIKAWLQINHPTRREWSRWKYRFQMACPFQSRGREAFATSYMRHGRLQCSLAGNASRQIYGMGPPLMSLFKS